MAGLGNDDAAIRAFKGAMMAGDEWDPTVNVAAAGWIDDGGGRGNMGLSSYLVVCVLSAMVRF